MVVMKNQDQDSSSVSLRKGSEAELSQARFRAKIYYPNIIRAGQIQHKNLHFQTTDY
jgi:hypothetical protein